MGGSNKARKSQPRGVLSSVGVMNRARVGVIVVGYVLLMQVAESRLRYEFTKSSWPVYINGQRRKPAGRGWTGSGERT